MTTEEEVIPSDPYWIQLLQETKIIDIVERSRKIIRVNYYEDVATLLKKLSTEHVLSAVVTDSEKPGVIGFVDVLDLMVFALEVSNSSNKPFSKESIQNLKWEGKIFSREIVGNVTNKSNADPYQAVDINTPLLEVVTLFSGEVHRLGVTEEGKLVNVISQMDIIRFLVTRGVYIGSKIGRTLRDNGLLPLGLASVLDTMSVIDTLKYMKDFKCSGLAVVDKHNRMVANFSATDLLGLNEENFYLLQLPVKEFLSRVYGYPKPPVVVSEVSTIEEVLLKISVHHVHRVYIVDESMRPLGVLTLTDIMQFLLANS